ncbi:response regulator [Hoeflea poritis]|uniref:histidine kinase n=1 Tax=Hoeflea poritis TaxID=2993659 RepID=A0ABT4VLS2_9HYPH|nr:response regulator [Hoeflea poritis]MDA4845656.1 response regulator [Hoeflea poritis]
MGELAENPKGRKGISIFLRVSYVTTILLIGGICIVFYGEQQAQNRAISHYGLMVKCIGELDDALAQLAGRAAQVETLQDDAGVESVKKGLIFRQNAVKTEFERFRELWLSPETPESLRQSVYAADRYMRADDPFKQYRQITDTTDVENAETVDDLRWAGKVLFSIYDSFLNQTGAKVTQTILDSLKETTITQGRRVQTFLLTTIAVLLALGLFVFLPIDLLLWRALRKLDLAIAQARQESRKAKAAEKTKSEFLANMSHEIRTPMNGVLGMAELLARTDLSNKQRTFTDIIVKSGQALLTIINDILDFSKIDARQMQLNPAPFSLREAIEDIATLLSGSVAEKDLEMVVRYDPQLPDAFVGDVGRIRQILTNIIGNAVKFTDRGQIMVNIQGAASQDTADIRISVKDTGPGIPADKLGIIFDKFSQVDGSSTRKFEGTGLGLAIAAGLVELMGGRIGVESAVGKGSNFWLELKLPISRATEHARPETPVDINGARIILVDGNRMSQDVAREQLRSWSFDCAAVESIPLATGLARKSAELGLPPGLIILDTPVPEEAAGQLRTALAATPPIAEIPILLMTAVDHVGTAELCERLGITGYVTKPVRASYLLETITAILTNKATGHKQPAAGLEPAPEENGTARAADRPVVSGNAHPEPAPQRTGQPSIDILVAEDNEVNQMVFDHMLGETGYAFRIANDGQEAVELWRELKPRLILMDVSMPRMNGYQATTHIRKQEAVEGEHTPIIGVTAHALKDDRARCLEAGMDDYMPKPISPEKLAQKIEAWLAETDEAGTYRDTA